VISTTTMRYLVLATCLLIIVVSFSSSEGAPETQDLIENWDSAFRPHLQVEDRVKREGNKKKKGKRKSKARRSKKGKRKGMKRRKERVERKGNPPWIGKWIEKWERKRK